MGISKTTLTIAAVMGCAVLNILFFLWTSADTRGVVEWSSYGFTMFAFVAAFLSLTRVSRDNNEVYNLTTVYVPVMYLTAQTVLSGFAIYYAMVIRNILEEIPTSFVVRHYQTIVLSVYIILCAFYTLRYLLHSEANKATEASLAAQAETRAAKNDVKLRVQAILQQVGNAEAAKALETLAETLRFCPNNVMANAATRDVINATLGQMEQRMAEGKESEVAAMARQLDSTIHQRMFL